MPGPALEILQEFRKVEQHQEYARLVDLFDDDAIIHDPFMGLQRGKTEIARFMRHMEREVRRTDARFVNWHIEADTNCGWADWDMVLSDGASSEVTVQGRSLYRLRNGKVSFLSDFIDTAAYRAVGGPAGVAPDHRAGIGASASPDNFRGPAHRVIATNWSMLEAGRHAEIPGLLYTDDAQFVTPLRGVFTGIDEITGFMRRIQDDLAPMRASFELVDIAGDESVGWAQWWFRLPGGAVPGSTLFTLRHDRVTYGCDALDVEVLRQAQAAS